MMRAEMEADWAKIRAKREAAMAKSEAEWASLVADLTAELRATRADLARLRQLKRYHQVPNQWAMS
jgi:ribosomal protein L29